MAGLATPVAASAITATMLTAINRVHLKNGPWVSNGGFEYNAVRLPRLLPLVRDTRDATLIRCVL